MMFNENMVYILGNGVKVINTTPHSITFLESDGETITIVPECGFILNANPVEVEIESQIEGVKFVKTVFEATKEGNEFINSIPSDVLVVSSLLAAQAYPGKAVALTPFPGYERKPIPEKRMNTDKFTVF